MIVYGTNGAHLRTAPLPDVACPSCTTADALQLSVYGRYVHIYGIPVLPYSKPAVAQCTHCRKAWEGNNLPVETLGPIVALKKETRAPFWHWSGLALLVVGVLWAMVATAQDDRANAAYLVEPKVGDIYTVRDSVGSREYSLLKVAAVHGNDVELVANNYQINNSRPLKELNTAANYSQDTFSLSRWELQIMTNKGQLTDVDRPGE